jgi:hypothetical protein
MVVNGPWLQRAPSVIVAKQSQVVDIQFSLAPELPTGFSGLLNPDNIIQQTDDVWATYTDWMAKVPMVLPLSPACRGTYSGKVKGSGVALGHCNATTWSIDSRMWHDPNATWGEGLHVEWGTNPIFGIGIL